MAHSHQSHLLSKAAAALHSSSVVVVFFVFWGATGEAAQPVYDNVNPLQCQIVASAVFLDFGITDAITDKHREYPASYVIPIKKKSD